MAQFADSAPSTGWLLGEIATAGRENLDGDHVARFDDISDSRAAAEVALLVELGLDEYSSVVDLGAGTGQFSLAVASNCHRVVAVDVSPVMLERLRSKVAVSGVDNVEVVHAGFLSYRHLSSPADFVYSRWALHHVPDFWKVLALRRVRSILRPRGILRLSDIVYSFDPSDAEERLEQWCATLPESGDDWVRADIEEHVRDEHSTFVWLLEAMMERVGFRIEDVSYTGDGIFAEYVAHAPLRRHRQRPGPRAAAAFADAAARVAGRDKGTGKRAFCRSHPAERTLRSTPRAAGWTTDASPNGDGHRARHRHLRDSRSAFLLPDRRAGAAPAQPGGEGCGGRSLSRCGCSTSSLAAEGRWSGGD